MWDPIEPGSVFAGRYRVERFIARGGFGAVYAAKQIDTEARVALKVLAPNVIASESDLDLLRHEARAGTRIASEHVARVFDVSFDPGSKQPYLVMELLEGQSFEELLRLRGPLSAECLVSYLRQVTYALDKAHGYRDRRGRERTIVHRDLKPDNLFLTRREDGTPLVKILDFGLAQVLKDSVATRGDLKGAPLFMAFELVTTGTATPQTDLWSLGLVAFFLLTGKHYWISASAEDFHYPRLLTEVLTAPLEAASVRAVRLGVSVAISPQFDTWFARCVNRDPAARFRTAGECASALAAALGCDGQRARWVLSDRRISRER